MEDDDEDEDVDVDAGMIVALDVRVNVGGRRPIATRRAAASHTGGVRGGKESSKEAKGLSAGLLLICCDVWMGRATNDDDNDDEDDDEEDDDDAGEVDSAIGLEEGNSPRESVAALAQRECSSIIRGAGGGSAMADDVGEETS